MEQPRAVIAAVNGRQVLNSPVEWTTGAERQGRRRI